jgi:hypothetical protein
MYAVARDDPDFVSRRMKIVSPSSRPYGADVVVWRKIPGEQENPQIWLSVGPSADRGISATRPEYRSQFSF